MRMKRVIEDGKARREARERAERYRAGQARADALMDEMMKVWDDRAPARSIPPFADHRRAKAELARYGREAQSLAPRSKRMRARP